MKRICVPGEPSYNSKIPGLFKLEDAELDAFIDHVKLYGLLNKQKRGKPASERTLINYRQRIITFRAFNPGIPWKDVRVKELRDFVSWLHKKGYSRGYIGNILHALQSFFNYLVELGKRKSNPCLKISKPSAGDNEEKPLTSEEYRLLLEASRTGRKPLRNEIFLRVLRETGLRISEALSIRFSWIDFGEGIVDLSHVKGDTHKNPYCVISRETLNLIESLAIQRLQEGDKSLEVLDMRVNYAGQLLRLWMRRAGIKKRVHAHLFRHTWATDFYRKTRDTVALKELGHWKSDVWRRYVHPDKEMIVEAGRDYLSKIGEA